MSTSTSTDGTTTGRGLAPELLVELARLSTPSILNALRGLGHDAVETMDDSVGAISPQFGTALGFAATLRVRITHEPESGPDPTNELRLGFWDHIVATPGPRLLVVENVGDPDAQGCFWGEVQANIHRALDCAGGIVNGFVRDVPEMEGVGFSTFSQGIAPGGGFLRYVESAVPVTVAGMTVIPGELIAADLHGVVKIPLELAARVPEALRTIEAKERSIIAVCQGSDFDLAALKALPNYQVKH
jgi:4-hydroxy-4-methyl-2-oxoglutarate aldolase